MSYGKQALQTVLGVIAGAIFLFGFGSAQTPIGSCDALATINSDLGGSYILTGNLDCTGSENSIMIGTHANPFQGSFDGNGFIIQVDINSGSADHIGLFRSVNGAVISNLGVSGSIQGNAYVGGLAGGIFNSTISNSYSTTIVSGNLFTVGGLIGYANSGQIYNSYSHSTVSSPSNVVGGLVGHLHNNSIISGSYALGFSQGQIAVGGLVGQSENSSIIGSYTFGQVSGIQSIGGLVGYLDYDSIITNSYTQGAVSGNDRVGGLVGYVDDGSEIIDSYAQGDVTGNDRVGGLVGQISDGSEIIDSYAQGDVTGNDRVGGLVGYAYEGATITNSYAEGDVVGQGSQVGGLVGEANEAAIDDSYALGAVDGDNYVGGLVGEAYYSEITNSYASGAVSGNNRVGGLVGYADNSDITNSYAEGDVTGHTEVGGLLGAAHNAVTITNSYAIGDVFGDDNVGGLVGYVREVTITNSYAEGDVTGHTEVGGLLGAAHNAVITNSYALGDVTGNDRIGGLVGYVREVTINNSYALGAVTGNNNVGGLVGYADNSDITNSYALGGVSGNNDVGGLVGYVDNSDITNSFRNIEVYGIDNGAGSGLNGSQLQDVNFLSGAGWSIATTGVNLNNGYPFFSRQVGDSHPPVWYVHSDSNAPIEISTCQGFMAIATNLGGNYVLTQDIDCTEEGSSAMIGTYNNPFYGTLDGQKDGHNNYMIEIDIEGNQNAMGLFRYVSGATIQNLVVSGSVNGTNGAGIAVGVVAVNRGGTTSLTNVHFYGDVTMATPDGYAGGIVGSASHFDSSRNALSGEILLTNVSFNGNLSSTSSLGGIIANPYGFDNVVISGATVSGSFFVADGSSVGGIMGSVPDNGDFAIYNSTVDVDFTGVAANRIGGLVGFAYCSDYDQAYRNENVLNNNNTWPQGLEAFGNNCSGVTPPPSTPPSQPSGGPTGGGPRLVQQPITSTPSLPRFTLNAIEKKEPSHWCGSTNHLSAGPNFSDVTTRYADAVNTLTAHCLVDGYNNAGKEFGVNNPLTAGEMYKVFALMGMLDVPASVPGLGRSHGFKTAGEEAGLWNGINTDRDQNAPVTESELLQVTFNYMKLVGLIDTIPDVKGSNRALTRGAFARFVNVVLGLVSTK